MFNAIAKMFRTIFEPRIEHKTDIALVPRIEQETDTETVWISEDQVRRFNEAQDCLRALAKMPGFSTLSLEELKQIALVSVYDPAKQQLHILSPDEMRNLANQRFDRHGQSKSLKDYSNSAVINLIANALTTNNELLRLALPNNDLGDAGALIIANILSNNKMLMHLNLRRNSIGVKGCIALLEPLTFENNTLHSLNLGCNQLGLQGVEFLSNVLSGDILLQELDLSHIEFTTKELKTLVSGLSANTSLQKIFLQDIALNTANHLEILRANKTLTGFDISYNDLKYPDVRKLLAALQNNPGSIVDVKQLEHYHYDLHRNNESRTTSRQCKIDEELNLICNDYPAAKQTEFGLFFSNKINIQLEIDWREIKFSHLCIVYTKVTRPRGAGELKL